MRFSRLWKDFNSGLIQFLNIGREPEPADAIFVFAGRTERKVYGYELFQKGFADCVIFSVGRFEWREFLRMFPENPAGFYDCVQATYYKERHFFVVLHRNDAQCFRVKKLKLGTLTEVLAILPLLHELKIKRLMIVTSNFHLRRSVETLKVFCKSQQLQLIPVAVPGPKSSENVHDAIYPQKWIILELIKYFGYVMVAPILKAIMHRNRGILI